MTLTEISSPSELKSFLTNTSPLYSVICFSATWCGPCRASKPDLMSMAESYERDTSMGVNFGIVLEDALGEELQSVYHIQAFPTYVLFKGEEEMGRIQGVNFDGVRKLIDKFECKKGLGEGHALAESVLSEEDKKKARENRLKSLEKNFKSRDVPVEDKDDNDQVMTEATAQTSAVNVDTISDTKSPILTKLDPVAIEQLTSTMGFSTLRSQKGLLNGGGTVEGAIEWLCAHQDDADIDDPICETQPTAGGVAQSYKCNECGKILSNMANLELHANKTGHSDFSESTDSITPLTHNEKVAKIAEIKVLLKGKRHEREEQEQKDKIDHEKQRRSMGKETSKTREEMAKGSLKRDAQLRRKVKLDAKREKERIRAEFAKDKAERAANGGVLHSRLGVQGYNPDAIQYDAPSSSSKGNDNYDPMQLDTDKHVSKKVATSSPKTVDEFIKKISAYRAGGDGGKCLKVLHIYIRNIVDNPTEDKYRHINQDNKAYKTKVKPFIGSKALLQACGFEKSDTDMEENSLVLKSDHVNLEFLKEVKGKLEDAMKQYA